MRCADSRAAAGMKLSAAVSSTSANTHTTRARNSSILRARPTEEYDNTHWILFAERSFELYHRVVDGKLLQVEHGLARVNIL